MSSPSIISAIRQLREILTREEKIKWVGIALFALSVSILEVITATVIVVFAQVLNQPEKGQKYLSMLGVDVVLSPGRTVFYIALMVGIVYLFKNLVAAGEALFQSFSIQKMGYHFRNRLLHRYAQTDYGFYLTRNSSLGLQVVGSDVESLCTNGMTSLAIILSESFVFLCLVGMIVYMNPSLALTIFGLVGVISLIIIKGLLPKFYGWGKGFQEAQVQCYKNLMQFFHAFKEVVLLGKRDIFIKRYSTWSFKKSRFQALQTAVNMLPRMAIEVLFVGLFVVIIAILCLEQESPVHMLGLLGGYLYAGFRLMPGLNRLISQVNLLKSAIPSIERAHQEYTNLVTEENYVDAPMFSFEKSIEIQTMSFQYLNTIKPALKNVSFQIKRGESIGIVGETGSGKSTLVDLILGLLRPSEGSILVDGKFPVNSYQWHKRIGYVPQSIYLTDDAIESNIAFGEEVIDQRRLQASIEAAQLEKFIEKAPEGLQTIVGERGIRVSGGERQRIAIARALYHQPDVLIFDEATSALDNTTEKKLMETIRSVSHNRTVIMIAHRLTTLKDCDRIVVMKEGGVDKVTTYEDL